MMAPDQTALIALLLLFGIAALEVCGRVCYVTQNLNRATKRSSWSLAEERPCECTNFRMGGVNINLHGKKLDGIPVVVNKQGQIQVPSLNCTEDPNGTTFEGPSLCAQNTHRFQGTMALQVPMTSPIRLEFTINTDSFVDVTFSPSGPDNREALYTMELRAGLVNLNKWDSFRQTWKSVQWGTETYMEVGLSTMRTYDNGLFEVEVQEVQHYTLIYKDVASPQQSWFVTFITKTDEEIIFTEPCINDFSPRFQLV